jgi:hypothetical protein
VGIAATTAVAGAAVGLTLSNGTPNTTHNAGVASSPLPAKATLQAKLDAAITAASGDIFYEHTAISGSSYQPTVQDDWTYPMQPVTGQQVLSRWATYSSGKPVLGVETSAKMPQSDPSHPATSAVGEETMVNYYSHAYWVDKDASVALGLPNPQSFIGQSSGQSLGQLNQQNIIDAIKGGNWKVAGHTQLDGQDAIKLSFPEGKGVTSYLWVDAHTYLPLQEVYSFSVHSSTGIQTGNWTTDFEVLPATSANLAQLTAPVPAGYKQVANPPY